MKSHPVFRWLTARGGFSLTEFLIYLAILGITSGFFVGTLTIANRIGQRQGGVNEVTNQANFVLQTIQRLVRKSSMVLVSDGPCTAAGDTDATPLGTPRTCLKLRMKDAAKDPTCIALLGGAVLVAEGPMPGNPSRCNLGAATALTTSRVTNANNALSFTKYSNPPGRDVIEIDLLLYSNTTNPALSVSKQLKSAVGRASAATFDSDIVLPSPPPNPVPDIGSQASPWDELWVQKIKGQFQETDNYGGAGRGMKIIGSTIVNDPAPQACNSVCQNHGLTCALATQYDGQLANCSVVPSVTVPGLFCWCK